MGFSYVQMFYDKESQRNLAADATPQSRWLKNWCTNSHQQTTEATLIGQL